MTHFIASVKKKKNSSDTSICSAPVIITTVLTHLSPHAVSPLDRYLSLSLPPSLSLPKRQNHGSPFLNGRTRRMVCGVQADLNDLLWTTLWSFVMQPYVNDVS